MDVCRGDEIGAFDADCVEERTLIGDVVVVAGEDVGGVVCLVADEAGSVVAVEVEDIVDGRSLLHEELDAIEVIEEGLAVVPPGDLG